MDDTTKDDFDQIGLYIDFNGNGYWPSPASSDKEGNWWIVAHTEGDFTAFRPLFWNGEKTTTGELQYDIVQLKGAASQQSGHMQYECSLKLDAIGNLTSGDSCKIWIFVLDYKNNTFLGWGPSKVTGTGKRSGWLDPLNYGILYFESPI